MRTRGTVLSFEFRVSSETAGRGTPCAPTFGHGEAARTGLTRPTFRSSAFTLLEIMVVVVLMSVIVIGLMAMFSQTQRAFRAGMTQTDVLEGGRTATEMLSRELEQITPSYANSAFGANFFVQVSNVFHQPLVGGTAYRINIMDDVFYLTRENQEWSGIGYFVRPSPSASGIAGPVGTLYRFQMTTNIAGFARNPGRLFFSFYLTSTGVNPANSNGVSKILDGVVSFKMRAFQPDGYWITNSLPVPFDSTENIVASVPDPTIDEVRYSYFGSNAVPAFVEFELGILEQNTYERYKSIPVYDAQTNFLAKQAGRLHLFRQRVAVRNVDRSAY